MVFRPEHSTVTGHLKRTSGIFQGGTDGQEGEAVKVSAIVTTPMARVVLADGSTERWYSHGTYLKTAGPGFIPTDEVWYPA
jgi:hypothetical protein